MHFKLKCLREEKCITQIKMAKLLNIEKSSYCRKERGNREFTINEALKLANYFKVNVEDLFKE